MTAPQQPSLKMQLDDLVATLQTTHAECNALAIKLIKGEGPEGREDQLRLMRGLQTRLVLLRRKMEEVQRKIHDLKTKQVTL